MIKRTKMQIITALISVFVGLAVFIAFSGLATAYTASNTVTASANVQGYCYISLSNTIINFGSIAPNANVPTNMLITDYDNGGNVAANILVAGTNWIYSSNTAIYFGVSNTLWSPANQATYNGIALTLSPNDTKIVVPQPTPTNTITSNNIYFGLAIPAGTGAGIYTQTITIEDSC